MIRSHTQEPRESREHRRLGVQGTGQIRRWWNRNGVCAPRILAKTRDWGRSRTTLIDLYDYVCTVLYPWVDVILEFEGWSGKISDIYNSTRIFPDHPSSIPIWDHLISNFQTGWTLENKTEERPTGGSRPFRIVTLIWCMIITRYRNIFNHPRCLLAPIFSRYG